MQKGTSRNSCLVPYTLQTFEALTPEGKPFEGIRAYGWTLSMWVFDSVKIINSLDLFRNHTGVAARYIERDDHAHLINKADYMIIRHF